VGKSVKNPSGYRSKGRTGMDKARQFAEHCREHEWEVKYSLDEERGVVYLFARRGDIETIEIWWSKEGKALPRPDLPVYTLGGERIKLLNVSAAAVRVASEPDVKRLQRAHRKTRKALGQPVAVTGSYDFSEHTDDEVEHELLGRHITWVNSLSGEFDSAQVAGRKTLKVTSENCKRQIHFTDESGFHAVYLDAIVSVK
jgi:hypothetical protein